MEQLTLLNVDALPYRDRLLLKADPAPLPPPVMAALELLSTLATVKDGVGPTSVKSSNVFRRPAVQLRVPLNRKTTVNVRQDIPLDRLEPTQEKIPAVGLQVYIVRPRRDPPDVLHVVMRDGRDRLVVQEGHTRLGAAVLRGETTMNARVWEFVQDAAGDFVPVPRGLQKRGLDKASHALSYRERLTLLAAQSEVADSDVINLPKAGWSAPAATDYDECLAQNSDKADPGAYCRTLGILPPDEDDEEEAEDEGDAPETVNMPDIADVSFPSMIGAMPSSAPAGSTVTKRKRKRPVVYKGVRLSRWPMKFEAEVMSLSEIPPRLDMAVETVLADGQSLHATMQDIANFGSREVVRELVRQGAPDTLLSAVPPVDATDCWSALTRDRDSDLAAARADTAHRVGRRRLSQQRRDQLTDQLFELRVPGITKRYAKRAVNDAFALGRSTAITFFRRKHEAVNLAYRDENGRFISEIEAVNSGIIAIDFVVQTAIMDTHTCDECSEVDGETMDLGDARQEELHPPYVKCLGGDQCRCVQIAVLENGKEINVDEIDEDTIG